MFHHLFRFPPIPLSFDLAALLSRRGACALTKTEDKLGQTPGPAVTKPQAPIRAPMGLAKAGPFQKGRERPIHDLTPMFDGTDYRGL